MGMTNRFSRALKQNVCIVTKSCKIKEEHNSKGYREKGSGRDFP